MFCNHKYGKVQEDGYQYCTKCNKAIAAPCPHKYERIKEYLNTRILSSGGGSKQSIQQVEYHLQCGHCGDIKVTRV